MLGQVAYRFIENFPSDAARVLEKDAADAIEEIAAVLPPPVGAALLRAITPYAAATGLARLNPATAAALTAHLPVEVAAALLLRLDAAARDALLNALPAKASAPIRLALRFPTGTVGSLIDARVATVRPDTRVEEVRELARRAPELLRKYLYVLDPGQRLTGVVDARQCLFEDADRRIGSLLRKDPVALRARTSLRQASLSPAWERFAVLPAVEHHGVFQGVVRRMTLFRALAAQSGPASQEDLAQLAIDLAELYWQAASNLLVEPSAARRRH